MRFPGVFRKGVRSDGLVSNIDVLPTLIEAAGAEVPDEIEGKSFYPALVGKNCSFNEAVFAEKTYHTSYDPVRCVRTKQYKYIFSFESVCPENYCLDIFNKPVLLENFGKLDKSANRFDELYDIVNDPLELKNLAGEEPFQEIRNKMAAALVKWMSETDDPLLKGPVASPMFYDRTDWLKKHLS
jgi:arylsulfatase A-like enzyme